MLAGRHLRFQVKSSQVAFNKKAMTIALHVHNVQIDIDRE